MKKLLLVLSLFSALAFTGCGKTDLSDLELKKDLLLYKKGNLYTGEIVKYHKNGKISDEGFVKEGKMDGKWLSYDKNGKLETKVTYKNGILQF